MILHDEIADRYDEDYDGILGGLRTQWERQVRATLDPDDHHRVLDIAAGTGVALAFLEATWGRREFSAIDISARMLQLAAQKLASPLRGVVDTALHAEEHFPAGSMDLVLGHLLYSYVAPAAVYRIAHRVLRPGGHLSVVTTTKVRARQVFQGPRALAGRVLRVERLIRESPLVETHAENLARLKEAGFEIVADGRHQHAFILRNRAALRDFALRASWLASYFEGRSRARLILMRALAAVFDWGIQDFFPIPLVGDFSLVIARKPAG